MVDAAAAVVDGAHASSASNTPSSTSSATAPVAGEVDGRKPAVQVKKSASHGVNIPKRHDGAEFVAEVEKLLLGARVEKLSAARSAAAVAIADTRAAATLPRQFAHMLLTKDAVEVEDIANPAQHWTRNYNDLLAEMVAHDKLHGGASVAERGEQAADDTDAWAFGNSEADDAFGKDTRGPTPLKSSGGTKGAKSVKSAGADSVRIKRLERISKGEDLSPPVGGALSFVPFSRLGPVEPNSQAKTEFKPNPSAVFYLNATIQQLEGAVATMRAFASSIDGKEAVPAGFDAGKATAVVAALVSSPSATAASTLSTEHSQWLASLAPEHAAELQKRILAARHAGLNVKDAKAVVAARIQKLEAAIGIIGKAASGSLAVDGAAQAGALPSLKALYSELKKAVGAGVEPFTLTTSAAAHVAGRVQDSLRAIETEVNAAAVHAQSTWAKARAAAGDAPSSARASSGGYEISIPSVADLVASSSAGASEVTSYTLTETASKRTFIFAASDDLHKSVATSSGGKDVIMTPSEALSLRLADGHVPSMLSPLMRILTPSQWATLDTIVRAALPDITATLALPIGMPTPALLAAQPTLTTPVRAAASVTVPTLVGAGPDSVSVPSKTATAASDSADSSGGEGGASLQIGTDVINPTGAPNSVLNLIARKYADQLGPSTTAATLSIKNAHDFAPSEASRAIYVSYLLRIRLALEALMQKAVAESSIKAAVQKLRQKEGGASSSAITPQAEELLYKGLRDAWSASQLGQDALDVAIAIESAVDADTQAAAGTASHAELASLNAGAAGLGLTSWSPPSIPGLPTTVSLSPASIAAAADAVASGAIRTALTTTVPASVQGTAMAGAKPWIQASVVSALAASLDLSPAPLPAVSPSFLAWAAQRAGSGYPAAGGAAAPTPATTAAGSATGAPASAATVVRLPKALINAQAIAEAGSMDAAFSDDSLQKIRSQRMGALGAEVDLLAEANAKGVSVSEVDPRWWGYSYTESAEYRAPQSYSLLHHRLLEAVEKKDLGAAWTLWTEHCALHPQEGRPDFLAIEIMMDACARAGRSDLVFGSLWPLVMHLRLQISPSMRFLMIKAAALDGRLSLAEGLLRLAKKDGAALDSRHYHAVISAAVDAGLKAAGSTVDGKGNGIKVFIEPSTNQALASAPKAEESFKKAYLLFNEMKRRGISGKPEVFMTLLAGAAEMHTSVEAAYFSARGYADADDAIAKGKVEIKENARDVASKWAGDCHYLWVLLQKSHAVSVPAYLYTKFIQVFAQQGNMEDAAAVIERMKRRADGQQHPSWEACSVLLEAHARDGRADKCEQVYE